MNKLKYIFTTIFALILCSNLAFADASSYDHSNYYAPIYEYDAYGNLTDNNVSLAMINELISPRPVVSVEEGSTNQAIDLDDYITDYNGDPTLIDWTVSGNDKVSVTIDPDTNEVVFESIIGWRGIETINFTATGPDGYEKTVYIEIHVTPVYGSISGTVTDKVSLQLLENIVVKLIDPVNMLEVDTIVTDINGVYTFSNVLANNYFVYIDASNTEYFSEYYPNTRELRNAIAVNAGGTDLIDINFLISDLSRLNTNIHRFYNQLSVALIPFDLVNPTKASDLVNHLSNQGLAIDTLMQWDGNGWTSHIFDDAGSDFDLDPKQGFYIKSNNAGIWIIDGSKIELPWNQSLYEGWNLIAYPANSVAATASELTEQINSQGGTALTVMAWDGEEWNTYNVGMPFGDFDLADGQSYFVECDGASTWSVE